MAQNATEDTNAPDVAHHIADLIDGEVIGYEAERDTFGIKSKTHLGDVATDAALKNGYVVQRMGSHPSDEYDYQVQFRNLTEK